MKIREIAQLAAAIAVLVGLAVAGAAPFESPTPELVAAKEPSLWFFLLSDRLTLGFVRVGLIMVAIYAAASIPALVVGGRWIKSFGTSVSADDAVKDEAKDTIAKLTKALQDMKQQRDRARQELRRLKDRLS